MSKDFGNITRSITRKSENSPFLSSLSSECEKQKLSKLSTSDDKLDKNWTIFTFFWQ
jgi:hypothetical protein